MIMRWPFFAVLGLLLLTLGIALIVYGQSIPVYYVGGGVGISKTGVIHGGLAPDYCEILVYTVPNTIHIRARSIEPVTVRIDSPNGSSLEQWENDTVDVDLTVTEYGSWKVYITQPSDYFVYGEVFSTAPLYAHPVLMYASIPILLGTMSLLHSVYRKKKSSYLENIKFEQNIGGRWIFLSWIPYLATISEVIYYIPSFPWLYDVLIAVTVAGVFFSFALAYVKLYLTTKDLYVEVPFLNFHKHYGADQIVGYGVSRENKERLVGFWKIRSWHPKQEDEVTISVTDPLPMRIWMTSFATRLHQNRIVFRPKSTEKFTNSIEKLGVAKK